MFRLAALALALLTVVACSGDRGASAPASAAATDSTAPMGDVYTEGGGFVPFYGEVKHEGRYHLFGNKKRFNEFMETKHPNELFHKKLVGEGAGGATLVVETDKESPTMSDRLVKRHKKLHNVAE